MSNIIVNDCRGGMYRAAISFTYGECDRLPFNILRRLNAKIAILPEAGITATADFNIRNPREAALFLETLDLFGDNGSYVHGSPSDPSTLALISPNDKPARAAAEADDLEMEN